MPGRLRIAGLLAAAVAGIVTISAVTAAQDEPPADAPAAPYSVAVLRALDKVTARVTTLQAPVGGMVRFGALEITTAVCDKRPPEETPEAAAFLAIVEHRPGVPAADVFRGWMFASSPGLSAMQHPVYDLWMLDCRSSLPSAVSNTSGSGSP